MQLRSTAFNDHGPIPSTYSHSGENVSPRLEWSGVSDNAAELVLLCEDPDAGRRPFVHWLVAGLRPTTTAIDAGKVPPEAVLGRNDFDDTGWDGPEPPIGDNPHRYFFRLYGLRHESKLAPGFRVDELRRHIERDAVDSGTLVGTFER